MKLGFYPGIKNERMASAAKCIQVVSMLSEKSQIQSQVLHVCFSFLTCRKVVIRINELKVEGGI